MNKIPVVIAKYLSSPEVKGFDINDKFAYLIKSVDGDNYYLCKSLPEEEFISEELGVKVYEEIDKNVTYKDILNWYKDWAMLL